MEFQSLVGGKKHRTRSAEAKARRLANKRSKRAAAGASRPKKEGAVWTLKNGAVGTWKNVNGKLLFRITKGANTEFLRSVGRTRGSKVAYPALSPRAAKMAFNKFYRSRSYKSDKARKAAMTRDLCSDNKPVVRDSRYRRSPNRYNYPGLDDGSQCPTAKVNRKRTLTAAQRATLNANLVKARIARGQKGGWAGLDEAFVGPATTPDGTTVAQKGGKACCVYSSRYGVNCFRNTTQETCNNHANKPNIDRTQWHRGTTCDQNPC